MTYPFIFKPRPFPPHLHIPANVVNGYREHDGHRVMVYKATYKNNETTLYIEAEDGWKGVAAIDELTYTNYDKVSINA